MKGGAPKVAPYKDQSVIDCAARRVGTAEGVHYIKAKGYERRS
jgi:hypothetical protein